MRTASPTARPTQEPVRFKVLIDPFDPAHPEAQLPVAIQYDSIDEAVRHRVLLADRERQAVVSVIRSLRAPEVDKGGLAEPDPASPGRAASPAAPSLVSSSSGGERRWIKQQAFADRHSVSLSLVRKWCMAGLPTNGVKGRGVRIRLPDADVWVESGGGVVARGKRREPEDKR